MQQDSSSEAESEKPLPEDASGDFQDVEHPSPEEGEVADDSVVEEEENKEPSLEEQVADWRERAIRSAADLENFRKRMEREKGEARRYANQSLLEELLPVLDNFHMGLDAASADAESMIFRGMEMVKKQLDDFLDGCNTLLEGVRMRKGDQYQRNHLRLRRYAWSCVAANPGAGTFFPVTSRDTLGPVNPFASSSFYR